MNDMSRLFSELGGEFLTPVQEIRGRLENIRAVVFDWDGVFNRGAKGDDFSSLFNEPDSMGTNMLRFGLWTAHGKLPVYAVISGARNKTALAFAGREHFNTVYLGIQDKQLAVKHLCAEYRLQPAQLACIFDDINDLTMAESCGLRCLVNRPASPLMKHYVRRRGLCDYITGGGSGDHGLREFTELVLGLMGIYDSVVDSRIAYDRRYQDYFGLRQKNVTRFYRQEESTMIQEDIMSSEGA